MVRRRTISASAAYGYKALTSRSWAQMSSNPVTHPHKKTCCLLASPGSQMPPREPSYDVFVNFVSFFSSQKRTHCSWVYVDKLLCELRLSQSGRLYLAVSMMERTWKVSRSLCMNQVQTPLPDSAVMAGSKALAITPKCFVWTKKIK